MRFTWMAGVLGLSAAAAHAGSVTIATFDDPADNALTPLFGYNATTNTLSGGWSFNGLSLATVGGDFENATFSMSADPGDDPLEVGPGMIEFRDEADTPILTIDFDSAVLSLDSFGATEFSTINDVVFSGSILPMLTQAESFSFALANQVAVGGDGSFTATAAFTSSAELIPEPATLLFLLPASVIFSLRRRLGCAD